VTDQNYKLVLITLTFLINKRYLFVGILNKIPVSIIYGAMTGILMNVEQLVE
jgi:hypothetical protein